MTSKDDIIADLRQQNADQAKQIAELLARVVELELQFAKATKDSSNSSRSPSSDIVKPPGKKTDRRKKAKRGGQKGPAKQVREPLAPDRLDEFLKHPDPATQSWAEELLDRSRCMFSAWHRREEMTEDGFRRSMIIHRDRFFDIVSNPPGSSEASDLWDRFRIVEVVDGSQYDMSQDYFRFMFESGVEPTNQHSEQPHQSLIKL